MSQDKSSKTYGSITTIFGPMFSSKTIELVSMYNKYSDVKRRCLYINSVKDIRTGSVISCNGSFHLQLPKGFCGIKTDLLSKVDVTNYDIILIDEAQLMPDLVDTARYWAEELDKYVIAAGLIATSEREQFGDLLTLILHSSDVIHTKAICTDCLHENQSLSLDKCPASFTSSLILKSDKESIGSSEKYKATCQKCYFRNLHRLQNPSK